MDTTGAGNAGEPGRPLQSSYAVLPSRLARRPAPTDTQQTVARGSQGLKGRQRAEKGSGSRRAPRLTGPYDPLSTGTTHDSHMIIHYLGAADPTLHCAPPATGCLVRHLLL